MNAPTFFRTLAVATAFAASASAQAQTADPPTDPQVVAAPVSPEPTPPAPVADSADASASDAAGSAAVRPGTAPETVTEAGFAVRTLDDLTQSRVRAEQSQLTTPAPSTFPPPPAPQ